MPETLDDFDTGSEATIDDFTIEKSPVGINSPKSMAHVAGHAAALGSSGDPVGDYRSITSEMSVNGESATLNRITQDFKEKKMVQARQGVIDILSDPTTSPEVARQTIQAFDEGFGGVNMRDMVSEQTVVNDSRHPSTPERDDIAVRIIDNVKQINANNLELEKRINSIAASDETLDTVVDVAELIIPFAAAGNVGDILGELRTATGKDRESAVLKGLALMGSTKAEIVATLQKVPPLQRMELSKLLISIVEENKQILLPDGNNLEAVAILKESLGFETYNDTDVIIDNIFSLIDIIGLGIATLGKGAAKAIKGAAKAKVKTGVKDTSISQNLKNTSPEDARVISDAALDDPELAEVTYGTTPNEVALHDNMPELGEADGVVKSKVSRPGSVQATGATPDADVIDFVQDRGVTHLTKYEKAALETEVVKNFKNAVGLSPRIEMSTIKRVDDGVDFKMAYGPSDNNWADPVDAIEQTKFALRSYGIDDEHITLMANIEGKFVPTTLEKLQLTTEIREAIARSPNLKGTTSLSTPPAPIDYMVHVDFGHKFNPTDLGATFENLTVSKVNFFSRFSALTGRYGRGSATRHMFDPDSLFDTMLTSTFNATVDQAGKLEHMINKLGGQFSKPFMKLEKDRQGLVYAVIKEANKKGIDHTDVSLDAAGLNPDEIGIVKKWRDVWDTLYWLENRDKAITLKARGVQMYVNNTTNTRFYGKKINQTDPIEAYNPITGAMEELDKVALDKLYRRGDDAEGGTILELVSPTPIDGQTVRFIKVEQGSKNSYLRAINENDQVLTHNKGYYQTNYDAPIFIEEIVLKADGTEDYRRAVATAGSIKDAEFLRNRLTKTSTDGNKFRIREDVKKGSKDFNDLTFEAQTSGGRMAQRVRGKRLESADTGITSPDQENILDPLDALTRSSRSISERVMLRDAIEGTKVKMMKQYGDLMPQKFGEPSWPHNVGEIGQNIDLADDTTDLAAARDLYEYVNTLENGFVNSLDDFTKSIINETANMVGRVNRTPGAQAKALGITEKGLRAIAEVTPTRLMKNLTFNFYLASAPLRQSLVQGHQFTQLFPIFPVYSVTKLVPQTAALWIAATYNSAEAVPKLVRTLARLSVDELDTMLKQYQRTGIHEAVDKQSFVRESLKPIASSQLSGKLLGAAGAPLRVAQKVGFDKGEEATQMTSWLAHRNRAIERGEDFTSAEVQTMVQGEAKAFTGSMNRAGDIAYTQNHLAVLMQYQQVPHKFLLQMTTNRHLDKGDKAKLFLWNTAMYGAPTVTVTNWLISQDPENKEWQELVDYGLFTHLYNAALSDMSGEDVNIDFTDLDPVNLTGMENLAGHIWRGDFGKALTSSPAGSLFFGNSPRLTNLYKTTARFFEVDDDFSDGTELLEVATEAAHLFSGLSHTFKAGMALEYGKKFNSTGGVSDSDVNKTEAIFAAFGMRTTDESNNTEILNQLYGGSYGKSSAFEDDLRTWDRDYKRHLFREGMTEREEAWVIRTQTEALRVFHRFNDKRARDILDKLRAKDIKDGDYRIFEAVRRATRQKPASEVKAIAARLGPKHRDMVLDIFEILEKTGDK